MCVVSGAFIASISITSPLFGSTLEESPPPLYSPSPNYFLWPTLGRVGEEGRNVLLAREKSRGKKNLPNTSRRWINSFYEKIPPPPLLFFFCHVGPSGFDSGLFVIVAALTLGN